MIRASRSAGYSAHERAAPAPARVSRPMADTKPSEQGKQEGIEESQQDRKQDETAKQRPGQTDQAIHDAGTRRPERKDTPEGA